MGRPRTLLPRTRTPIGEIGEIKAMAVYSSAEAARLLRMGIRKLRREVHGGRISYEDRNGKWFFRGQWLLDWQKDAKQGIVSQSA